MTEPAPRNRKRLRRDVAIAAACGVLVAAMVGASFAAIPLYKMFCSVTGFAGTTQVARIAPKHELGRELTIRFDSNVAPGLPWKFEPEQNEIKLHIGEVATVHYKVINEAARAITAQASYNVTPTDGRRLFRQDQLLLLYPADHEAGRDARDDGGVLRRSQDRQ